MLLELRKRLLTVTSFRQQPQPVNKALSLTVFLSVKIQPNPLEGHVAMASVLLPRARLQSRGQVSRTTHLSAVENRRKEQERRDGKSQLVRLASGLLGHKVIITEVPSTAQTGSLWIPPSVTGRNKLSKGKHLHRMFLLVP